jgi:hypothetical protein
MKYLILEDGAFLLLVRAALSFLDFAHYENRVKPEVRHGFLTLR